MTDQEKIDEVTARLTGMVPIHTIREQVLEWMKGADLEDRGITYEEKERGFVKYLSKTDLCKISLKDWRILLAEHDRSRKT